MAHKRIARERTRRTWYAPGCVRLAGQRQSRIKSASTAQDIVNRAGHRQPRRTSSTAQDIVNRAGHRQPRRTSSTAHQERVRQRGTSYTAQDLGSATLQGSGTFQLGELLHQLLHPVLVKAHRQLCLFPIALAAHHLAFSVLGVTHPGPCLEACSSSRRFDL